MKEIIMPISAGARFAPSPIEEVLEYPAGPADPFPFEATPFNSSGNSVQEVVTNLEEPQADINPTYAPRVITEKVADSLAVSNVIVSGDRFGAALVSLFGMSPEHSAVIEALIKLSAYPRQVKFSIKALISV